MSFLVTYLLQVTCISGLLYGYYHVALRNRQFHQYNRFYLLGSAALAIVLPFLQIPVYFTHAETENSLVLQTLTVISSAGPHEAAVTAPVQEVSRPVFSTAQVLLLLYGCIATIILARVLFSLLRIRRMKRHYPSERIDRIVFVNTTEPGTPYSFFRWLFWNSGISLRSEKGEQIFRHELFHIRQRHSVDVMFMELLTIICWVNPFFHLMKKEVRAIHEFLADQYAMNENRKWEYAELLLMQALDTRQRLVNPFFHNQIKRRIAMITTSQKPSYRYARKLMVLPLAAAAAAIFAFSYRKQQDVRVEGPTRPITVVIDAGHGGEDKGALTPDGIAEKDIVLAIARKIRELNADPQVTILLTREADVFPKLKDRTDLAAKHRPDLFLSLHLNSNGSSTALSPKSGVEIFLARNSREHGAESRILAGILLNYLHPLYATAPVIRQAESSIWVLENAGCPSALVELGYMENRNDMALLVNPAMQEKIAKSILLSIDQYMVQRSGNDWEERRQQVSGESPFQAAVKKSSGKMLLKEDGFSIIADTVLFEDKSTSSANQPRPQLYVINGKLVKPADVRGYHILSKSITVYKANSPQAIEKFGEAARHGVMEFRDAVLTSDLPVRAPATDTTKPEPVFEKVEIEAGFPGGMTEWKAFLDQHLKHDLPGFRNLKDGDYSVILRFLVSRDGTISAITTLTKFGHGMEEEAIRVISQGPRWTPAMQNGKLVTSWKKLPVTFRVRNAGKAAPGDDAHAAIAAIGVESLDIQLRSATEMISADGVKLDPSALYVGIDNRILVSGSVPIDNLHAEISQGTITRQGDYFVARVTQPGEAAIIITGKGQAGKSVGLKKVVFKTKYLTPPAEDPFSKTPKISVRELHAIDVATLLKVPSGAQVESFTFTIDQDNGDIVATHNTKDVFSPATRQQMRQAAPGRLITIDNIRVSVGGVSRKIPSQVYQVVP